MKLLSTLLLLFFLVSCGPQGTKKTGHTQVFNGKMRLENSYRTNIPLRVDIAMDTRYSSNTGGIYSIIDNLKETWDVEISEYNFFNENAAANTVVDPDYANIEDYYYSDASNWGIYIKESNWYPNISTQALAVTQYFGYIQNTASGEAYLEIIHSDIIINEDIHDFALNPNSQQYDLETVILHELGHFLGLHHSSSITSVMYPSLSEGVSRPNLSADDADKLNQYYQTGSHAGLTASGSSFILGASSEGNNPNDLKVGDFVRGVIELRADGECHHYENHKLVKIHSHQIKLPGSR